VSRNWWDVTGTDMTGQEMLTWGPSMRWVLRLIETGMPSRVAGVDVMEISRPDGASNIADLGLTLSEAKQLLACVQQTIVGAQRPLKDFRRRRLTSLYGVVKVRAPRFDPCRCGVASRRTIAPVAEIMPDRCTPEYERTLAKMASLLPYRRARALLDEFFPLGDAPEVETIRQRTLHVGARLETEAVRLPTPTAPTEA
jgi:hypothetical protein